MGSRMALALHWQFDGQYTVQVDVRRSDGAVMQVFLEPASGTVVGTFTATRVKRGPMSRRRSAMGRKRSFVTVRDFYGLVT